MSGIVAIINVPKKNESVLYEFSTVVETKNGTIMQLIPNIAV